MPDKYTELDLELEIARYDDKAYAAQITRKIANDNSDHRRYAAKPIVFDFEGLLAASSDATKYGELLTEQLFAADELREEIAIARNAGFPIRFRLSISHRAPKLHDLRWETLRDPADRKIPLLINENILFSRHVFTFRGQPVKAQRPQNLKALVVIASPKDLDKANTGGAPLAPIVAADELKAAEKRLAGFEITALASGGKPTLENIIEQLSKSEFTVLYIHCHGAIIRGRPHLILENEKGMLDQVLGWELEQQISTLRNPPRLVVLASCKSGGGTFTWTGERLSRLGSSLAVDAGIPAVIAMQGDISNDTVSKFLEQFFEHLRQNGEVDWAMTVARRAVQTQSDSWMPMLYMRLLDGRLWSEGVPELLTGEPAYDKWEDLLRHVSRGRCTPIIGFGVYEELFGSSSSLAQRWAENYRYPLKEGDELPQIAQYLAINHDVFYPRDQLKNQVKHDILSRAAQEGIKLKEEKLDAMIVEAWQESRKKTDPHRILAHLPCSLYLTTNLSTIMEAALTEAKVKPQSVICDWNSNIQLNDPPPEPPPKNFEIERPTVYHLFGRFDNDESLVITEDNYFDYLVGTSSPPEDSFHKKVQGKLNSSALILLGYQITEWSLRVLFRSIMQTQGQANRFKYTHVAVQVDPRQNGVNEPDRVYAYLSGYFQKERITIFPGTVAQFIDRLIVEYKTRYGEDLTSRRAKVIE